MALSCCRCMTDHSCFSSPGQGWSCWFALEDIWGVDRHVPQLTQVCLTANWLLVSITMGLLLTHMVKCSFWTYLKIDYNEPGASWGGAINVFKEDCCFFIPFCRKRVELITFLTLHLRETMQGMLNVKHPLALPFCFSGCRSLHPCTSTMSIKCLICVPHLFLWSNETGTGHTKKNIFLLGRALEGELYYCEKD